MTPLTRYRDVDDIALDVLAGVRRALGDDLVAMYLGGSLALDAFSPATSDVDFVVIMDGDISDDQAKSLRLALEEITSRSVYVGQEAGGALHSACDVEDWAREHTAVRLPGYGRPVLPGRGGLPERLDRAAACGSGAWDHASRARSEDADRSNLARGAELICGASAGGLGAARWSNPRSSTPSTRPIPS